MTTAGNILGNASNLEFLIIGMYMYVFSYLCKTELENGISCLISALGVNFKYTSGYNSRIFQKYSRMLITQQSGCASGMDCFRNFEKSKIWPFCLHLNSQVPLNCKDTTWYNSWIFQKYFRMLITQESGCASGMDCFWNLNWRLKNQKSELFVINLMVRYWSDRVKFWIYTAFKAFRISH